MDNINIEENDSPIALNKQSTGFKWFFDFYFTTISNDGLKPGDIVLLDEPAINLHPQSQIELRLLMKDFAQQNDITFIISTHSPFLVDYDHLDELRIVKKESLITEIENKFTQFDEIDVSEPIQSALTIERFMMFNPKNNVVFVEGITDYNYLIGFKKLFKEHNLTFIPLKGLLEYSDEKIQSISDKFRTPIVLVDADDAGMKFAKKCEEFKNISVVAVNEVGGSKVTIEDLFSSKDKTLYLQVLQLLIWRMIR